MCNPVKRKRPYRSISTLVWSYILGFPFEGVTQNLFFHKSLCERPQKETLFAILLFRLHNLVAAVFDDFRNHKAEESCADDAQYISYVHGQAQADIGTGDVGCDDKGVEHAGDQRDEVILSVHL